MSKITRTPTFAGGGITKKEKAAMDAHAQLWISRAMRTEPIEPDKIVPAIKALYAAAGLKEPRVIIVPSPLVMAFAGGFASVIWRLRKNATHNATRIATYNATRNATDIATYDATDIATYIATRIATYNATRIATDSATHIATLNATDSATHNATDIATDIATFNATHIATLNATDSATHNATDSATHNATDIATDSATRSATLIATINATDIATDIATANADWPYKLALDIFGNDSDAMLALRVSQGWSNQYQGGNMWAAWECYLTAARDILGLKLPEHEKYAAWEQCAIHGGFRYMHEEFCLVCDFPEILTKDAENRPHGEKGPSHRWRDGWELFHWHGVVIPGEWVTGKPPSAHEALNWPNIEQRRAACEIIGWKNILAQLKPKIIDANGNEEIGTLIEVDIPDSGRERFLRVMCGTKREFCLPVPRDMKTAVQANAWTYGLNADEFKPEVRT